MNSWISQIKYIPTPNIIFWSNNILNTVESTINDEDIKKETKEVVTKINDEFKLIINDAKENFSEIFVNDSTIEEE